MNVTRSSSAFDKRRQDRRDEILEAAIQCFADRGYEGATLQDIADQIGLTHPALYYYYKSKEVLLFQSAEKILIDLMAALNGADPGTDAPADKRLSDVVKTQINYQFDKQKIAPFIDSVLFGAHSKRNILSHHYLEKLRAAQRSISNLYKDIIISGQRQGLFSVPDINAVVFSIIGMISHTVYWYRPASNDDRVHILQTQAELCLKLCMESPRFP